MAQLASAAALVSEGWSWSGFWNFVRRELAPYPGRGWLVARITIAATVMMLCIVTFRLPSAALGAYYTLVISRDTTHATLDGVVTLLSAISLALVQVLFGAMLFAGSPLMHFLWVVGALFSTFFLISAATRYNFATSFGFLVIAAIPLWDFPIGTGKAVSNTLYLALAVTLGAVITVVVEMLFAAFSPHDLIRDGVDDRLKVVSRFLREVHDPDDDVKAGVAQYADVGMGQLRRFLVRAEGGSETYSRKAVLIGLTGRLVDLCAGLLASNTALSESQQQRLYATAGRIDQIREWGVLSGAKALEHERLSSAGPGFVELLESTVQLMNDALEQPALMKEYTATEESPKPRLLKRDAFTNLDHLKFALRGTAAALICFTAYHLLDWRGLYNSMATCMVTALSTSGSSRQKQVLRVSGAITGGLFLGITSEVFLLPHMESIAEFSLLFAGVTALAAWFATASPRLSYYGLQVAFAFDLVQLRTFAPDTQLTPARDNVAGILLGLIAMWVVFDQLTKHNSLVEMKTALVGGIRAMTAYIREPRAGSRTDYLKRVRRYRDVVNENLLNVRTSADALLFEFDQNRQVALKARANVRAWHPQLRTLFLLQITLAHMRLRAAGAMLPVRVEQLLSVSAEKLDAVADMLEAGAVSEIHKGGDDADETEREVQRSGGEGVAESLVLDSLVIANDLLKQVRSTLKPSG